MAKAKRKCKQPRPKVLSESAKAEIIGLRAAFKEIQSVEILRHDIGCGDCAKRFRDACSCAAVKTLILDRIDQLNNGSLA